MATKFIWRRNELKYKVRLRHSSLSLYLKCYWHRSNIIKIYWQIVMVEGVKLYATRTLWLKKRLLIDIKDKFIKYELNNN